MIDEKQLIRQCKNGDIQAFEKLIEGYQKKVYNIAYRMLGNSEDAFDVSQEVFIKVFKAIVNFKEESSFSTWIYRIAKNVCLDELRKKKKAQVVSIHSTIQADDSEFSIQLEDFQKGPEELLEIKELKNEVNKAINCLTDEHKLVIQLRDISGFSYEEIAEILQCSLGTVKSRISRARNSLKNILISKQEHFKSNGV